MQPAQPTLGTSAVKQQGRATELEAALGELSKPRLHVRGPREGLALDQTARASDRWGP